MKHTHININIQHSNLTLFNFIFKFYKTIITTIDPGKGKTHLMLDLLVTEW